MEQEYKPWCEYIKNIMQKDPATGNELLRLNSKLVMQELGIKLKNEDRIGKVTTNNKHV